MWIVTVVDRMELIEQDYVLVSSPPVDASSSASVSNFPSKSGSPLQPAGSSNPNLSAPIPIISESAAIVGRINSFESRSSAPGTSHGSTDMVDALEQPSTDCITRIKSLQRCALAITELVTEKVCSSLLSFLFFFPPSLFNPLHAQNKLCYYYFIIHLSKFE